MRESDKALKRLQSDYLWQRASKSPKPHIDIGCGDCPIPGAEGWDKAEGDAQTLPGVPNGAYGLVWSSHCLEHLVDWQEAISRWIEVTSRGGFLWILVPDFELYEGGYWPSRYNPDHKHQFSVSILMKWAQGQDNINILRIQLVDSGYDYSITDCDQTIGGAEACVEMVLQKL